MTDTDFGTRLEALEVRYAHQESALEEVTRTLLGQEQQLRALAKLVERLETQLRTVLPSGAATNDAEPPPHY